MRRFDIHPKSPQHRLITQCCQIIENGAIAAMPTDSSYALVSTIGNRRGAERIRNIRQLEKDHAFTLLCHDFSDLSRYARFGSREFRLMRACFPGPYTFILPASREVPRAIRWQKRHEIGIRIPANAIVQSILRMHRHPLMSVTLQMPEDDMVMTEADAIEDALAGCIDLLIDGGSCGLEPTSIINLTGDTPEVVRQGKGAADFLTSTYRQPVRFRQ